MGKPDFVRMKIEKLRLEKLSIVPPRPKGPPLNALRAFESAARLGGFALAAEELCVTPGAISQHIKTLEDWLGAELFQRRAHGVELTDLGADTLPDLSTAFDAMGAAVHAMRAGSGDAWVHIAALPSVAQLWVSPRLPALRAALPEVSLSISAIETPPNLARGVFDLSVFLRPATGAPGETVLVQDMITPVCTPELARRLQKPSDLRHMTLLHDALWAGDWALWANVVLGEAEGFGQGPRYSLYALALEEARHGAGVLMGHEALVRPALERGDLVAPFPQAVPTGLSLVLETVAPRRSNAVRQAVISRLLK